MTRQLLYVAAPLAPTEDEMLAGMPSEALSVGLGRWTELYPGDVKRHAESNIKANLDRALRWVAWLRKSFPETTFIAPWIATVMSLDGDGTPEEREAGLFDDCAVVERCDGIVLCGGRISSGMQREMEHGIAAHRLGEEYARAAIVKGPVSIRDLDAAVVQLCGDFAVYDLTKLGRFPPFVPWDGLPFTERFSTDGSWR